MSVNHFRATLTVEFRLRQERFKGRPTVDAGLSGKCIGFSLGEPRSGRGWPFLYGSRPFISCRRGPRGERLLVQAPLEKDGAGDAPGGQPGQCHVDDVAEGVDEPRDIHEGFPTRRVTSGPGKIGRGETGRRMRTHRPDPCCDVCWARPARAAGGSRDARALPAALRRGTMRGRVRLLGLL